MISLSEFRARRAQATSTYLLPLAPRTRPVEITAEAAGAIAATSADADLRDDAAADIRIAS
jgi:hypothetical protein